MKVLNVAGYPSLTGLFFTFKSTRILNNVEKHVIPNSISTNYISLYFTLINISLITYYLIKRPYINIYFKIYSEF
jgi:hypothetical protein